jgi:hypothetical protein
MHDKFHLTSLTLGGVKLTDVPVLSTDNLATPVRNPHKKDPPPILGMDILKHYRVLLDFPGRMMYIQPPDPSLTMPRPDNAPPASTQAPASLVPATPAAPH